MERIAYLDYVSLPIYAIILFATIQKKMIYGPSNKFFSGLLLASLITAICDTVTGSITGSYPLSDGQVVAVSLFSGLYFIFHTLVPVLYVLFVLAETRCMYWMTQKHRLLITFIPYLLCVVLVLVNIFTGILFTVTNEQGYVRGPAIYIVYAVAAMYAAWALTYLISRRTMLTTSKWISLLMMIFLNAAAVLFQLFFLHNCYIRVDSKCSPANKKKNGDDGRQNMSCASGPVIKKQSGYKVEKRHQSQQSQIY